jgi:copper homeostasis protein
VLSSGGAASAERGVEGLSALVRRANGHVAVVAGGGVRGDNARRIVDDTGVRELHARCGSDTARIRAIKDAVSGVR